MNSDKSIARLVGVLSLLAVLSFAVSFSWSSSIIGSGSIVDKLNHIYLNVGQFRMVIFLEVIALVAGLTITALLYTILKKVNQAMATTALVLSIGGSLLFAVGLLLSFFPVTLFGKELAANPNADTAYYETLTRLAFNLKGWSHGIALMFGAIASVLNYLMFFQAKYIPRALSVAGILVPLSVCTGAALIILLGKSYMTFFMPNLFFQLSIGFWLAIKGVKTPEETKVFA